ncbi:glycerophosphodiester phosphodiesterase family protein [Defluviimonas salinarum]|uniref:Glycerophosphoryl diester phosphodiesterase membrane domain-containing protein n=1 Tax=Defluviimonas salinarum TaxID=2992147 RepID=A0ABT3J6Z4_9RHOB|nr:glycerophosphodiester phosphodiesterase family protein [Defluviimonas salinarum]MCW3783446.1 glycerophosphoryl diester phosphodiesterase membrane domain-containing protein [Defluviimonas salinarum]
MGDVAESYRQAFRFLAPFLLTHIALRLVSAAIVLPLIGVLLALTLKFSDQTALTDQDIARFIFTPAGAVGALLIGSAVIAAMTLDVAVMTATIRSGDRRPAAALSAGVAFAVRSAPVLLAVAAGLLLRIVAMAMPFLAVCGVLYVRWLSTYDINYYLTYRPPEFLTAVGLIALVLAALTLVLLDRLTGWALVLQRVLFERSGTNAAFRESRALMKGRRIKLIKILVLWLAVRLTAGAAISAATAFALAYAPALGRQSLASAAIAVLVFLAASLAATTTLSAWSNGALAKLLFDLYRRVSDGRAFDRGENGPSSGTGRSAALMVGGFATIGVLSLGSIGTVVAFSERIKADADVVVIGHRGAAASRPENSMASVRKAIEDGADWVEIDVQESADGEVVVAHDSDFMKSAGNPLKVWDATLRDLDRIDIGSWFDPAYSDERTPLLRDVLLAAKGRSRVIIELKYYGYDVDLENRVIAVVEETGMADSIATMSLKYPAVQKMRALRPEWRTGVLAATAIGDLSGLDGDFLAVSLTMVSPYLVRRAESAGKDVYAWTVNDAATMSRMISMGVGGLITDEPELARRVIVERNALPTIARLALWISDSFGVTFDRLANEVVEQ